jgi:hypothetical protein
MVATSQASLTDKGSGNVSNKGSSKLSGQPSNQVALVSAMPWVL